MQLFPQRNIPRIIIFLGDVIICAVSIYLAYLLRFNFNVPDHEWILLMDGLPVFFGIRILTFYLFKTYAGIIRYTSTRDASRILLTLATGSLVFALLNPLYYYFSEKYLLQFSSALLGKTLLPIASLVRWISFFAEPISTMVANSSARRV